MATTKKKTRERKKAVKKRGRGRPSEFKPEYVNQAYKLALLSLTDTEIANVFDVSESTLNLWKKQHSEFSESITRGKESADANVADRLYQRAMGYEHDDVHISTFEGDVIITPIRKHYPPDTQAASLWLRNRQPRKWRDKQEHVLSTDPENPIRIENIPTDARRQIRQAFEQSRFETPVHNNGNGTLNGR